LELVEAGEKQLLTHRLAEWFLNFVRAGVDHNLASVFEMLPDLDNIRSVIEAELRDGSHENVAIAGELVGSYRHLWMSTARHLELRQMCKAVQRVLDEGAYPKVAALLATVRVGTDSALRTDLLEAAIEANEKIGDFSAVSAHLARLAFGLAELGRTTEALERASRAEQVLQKVSPSSRVQDYVRSFTSIVFASTGDIPRARRAIAELDRLKAQQDASHAWDYVLQRNSAVAQIDFIAGDYASCSELCRETMYRLASAALDNRLLREIRLTLIESELMLDRVESALEECRKLLLDPVSYVEYLEIFAVELIENIALVAIKREMPEYAAQLLAYSDHGWKRLGYTRPDTKAGIARKAHRLLELALPEGELRRARDAGERLTADEARQLGASVLT